MKAITIYLWNLEPTLSSDRFSLPFFNIYDGFYIWQDLEYMGRVTVGKLPW